MVGGGGGGAGWGVGGGGGAGVKLIVFSDNSWQSGRVIRAGWGGGGYQGPDIYIGEGSPHTYYTL